MNESDYQWKLGSLAGLFRGGRDNKKEVIAEYQRTLRELIASGLMTECLGPEDELPDEFMPEEYMEWIHNGG